MAAETALAQQIALVLSACGGGSESPGGAASRSARAAPPAPATQPIDPVCTHLRTHAFHPLTPPPMCRSLPSLQQRCRYLLEVALPDASKASTAGRARALHALLLLAPPAVLARACGGGQGVRQRWVDLQYAARLEQLRYPITLKHFAACSKVGAPSRCPFVRMCPSSCCRTGGPGSSHLAGSPHGAALHWLACATDAGL